MPGGALYLLVGAALALALLAGLLGSFLFILGSARQSRTLRLLALPPFGCAALVLLALVALVALVAYLAATSQPLPPSP